MRPTLNTKRTDFRETSAALQLAVSPHTHCRHSWSGDFTDNSKYHQLPSQPVKWSQGALRLTRIYKHSFRQIQIHWASVPFQIVFPLTALLPCCQHRGWTQPQLLQLPCACGLCTAGMYSAHYFQESATQHSTVIQQVTSPSTTTQTELHSNSSSPARKQGKK